MKRRLDVGHSPAQDPPGLPMFLNPDSQAWPVTAMGSHPWGSLHTHFFSPFSLLVKNITFCSLFCQMPFFCCLMFAFLPEGLFPICAFYDCLSQWICHPCSIILYHITFPLSLTFMAVHKAVPFVFPSNKCSIILFNKYNLGKNMGTFNLASKPLFH